MKKKLAEIGLILFAFLNKSCAAPFICCGNSVKEPQDERIHDQIEKVGILMDPYLDVDSSIIKGAFASAAFICLKDPNKKNPSKTLQESQQKVLKLILDFIVNPTIEQEIMFKAELGQKLAALEMANREKTSPQSELRRKRDAINVEERARDLANIKRSREIEVFCKECGINLLHFVSDIEYHFFNPRIKKGKSSNSLSDLSKSKDEADASDAERTYTLIEDRERANQADSGELDATLVPQTNDSPDTPVVSGV